MSLANEYSRWIVVGVGKAACLWPVLHKAAYDTQLMFNTDSRQLLLFNCKNSGYCKNSRLAKSNWPKIYTLFCKWLIFNQRYFNVTAPALGQPLNDVIAIKPSWFVTYTFRKRYCYVTDNFAHFNALSIFQAHTVAYIWQSARFRFELFRRHTSSGIKSGDWTCADYFRFLW